MSKEAMKLALEALVSTYQGKDKTGQVTEAITALREALAKHLAVPDAIHHTDTSETLEYIQGWNDCRAETLKMRKQT